MVRIHLRKKKLAKASTYATPVVLAYDVVVVHSSHAQCVGRELGILLRTIHEGVQKPTRVAIAGVNYFVRRGGS
jgi:hypothetical protein